MLLKGLVSAEGVIGYLELVILKGNGLNKNVFKMGKSQPE